MSLQISRMRSREWKKWSRKVMGLMRSVLPEKTQLTARSVREVFAEYRHCAFLARVNGKFAGFALGFFHVFDDEPEIALIGDKSVFHLCVNLVAPEFHDQGIGRALILARINEAKRRGAEVCTSFARDGASLHNLLSVGGRVIGVRDNFLGSGERSSLVRIDLS